MGCIHEGCGVIYLIYGYKGTTKGIYCAKQKELDERLNNLKEQIEYWTENETDKMIETIQLYYDK